PNLPSPPLHDALPITGISTDLMFFAVSEPVTQYLNPPSTQPETVEAARESTAWTLFHYGISGWGLYALMGMALAYFAYRKNMPLDRKSTRLNSSHVSN